MTYPSADCSGRRVVPVRSHHARQERVVWLFVSETISLSSSRQEWDVPNASVFSHRRNDVLAHRSQEYIYFATTAK